jgi:hypothetical protein
VRAHAGWLGGGPLAVVGQDLGWPTLISDSAHIPWVYFWSEFQSVRASLANHLPDLFRPPLRLLARLAMFYQRPQRLVDVPEAGAGCLTDAGAVVFMLFVRERVSNRHCRHGIIGWEAIIAK